MIGAIADPFATGSLVDIYLRALGSSRLRRTPARSGAVQSSQPAGGIRGKSELSEDERREVDQLERRDQQVRQHEAAHQSAAGQYASGGAQFEYTRGPDGKQYATGGEVQIDTSEVPGDPQATIRKMEQIRRAANAPAEPSAQDRNVAAQAAQIEARARAELNQTRRNGDTNGNTAATAGTSTGTSAGTLPGTSTGTLAGTSTGTQGGTSAGTLTGTLPGTSTGTLPETSTGTMPDGSTGTLGGTLTDASTATLAGTSAGTSAGVDAQPQPGSIAARFSPPPTTGAFLDVQA